MVIDAAQLARMRRHAGALVPRQDADLVQDSLVRALEASSTPVATVAGWLSSVVRTTHLQRRCATKRGLARDTEWYTGAGSRTAANQIDRVELVETCRTLAALSERWRAAVQYAVNGVDVAGTAAALGVHRQTAAWALANARRVLRDPELLGSRMTTRGKASRNQDKRLLRK